MYKVSAFLLFLLFVVGCVSAPVPSPTEQTTMASHQTISSLTPTVDDVSILLTERVGTVIAIQTASATPLPTRHPPQTLTPEPTLTPSFTPIPTLPNGVIFSKVYDEEGYGETAYSIISTADGGYLITAQASYSSCSILKVDSAGEEEWRYVLGEELGEEFVGNFRCWSLKQIANGNYVVLGSGHKMYGSGATFFVLKLDSDGARKTVEEFRWIIGMGPRLDKEGNLFWLSLFGLYGVLIETSNHGYAVAGTFLDNTLDDSMHLFRADANGNYLWERNLCQDKNIREEWQKKIACSDRNLWDAIESQDGGFVILGRSPGIWLMKTDANGNVEWIKSYHGSEGHAVIQTPDSGFLITGSLNKDGLLIKTDGSGNVQWTKTFGEDQNDVFKSILMNLQGNIVVLGSKGSDIWLLELDLAILK